MALKLAIPEGDWNRLLQARMPNSNGQQASSSPVVPWYLERILTATPCTYVTFLGDKEVVKKELLAFKLAEVMLSDLSDDGKLPVALWKGKEMQEKRNDAEELLCQNDKEELGDGILEGECWTDMISGTKNGTFIPDDLLAIGEINKPWEVTMAGLAGKVETFSRMAEFRPSQYEDPTAYVALILDLGKAATECSDMKTYMRISLFLFLAVNRLWIRISSSKSSDERKQVRAIGRKYLRNYVTLVLLGEALSALGDAQKKEELPI